eukprot:m.8780 g.8780  ORF g.8780 m.8780 type:complete len:308 (-) comp3955_c0_seq1:140-1063(-)
MATRSRGAPLGKGNPPPPPIADGDEQHMDDEGNEVDDIEEDDAEGKKRKKGGKRGKKWGDEESECCVLAGVMASENGESGTFQDSESFASALKQKYDEVCEGRGVEIQRTDTALLAQWAKLKTLIRKMRGLKTQIDQEHPTASEDDRRRLAEDQLKDHDRNQYAHWRHSFWHLLYPTFVNYFEQSGNPRLAQTGPNPQTGRDKARVIRAIKETSKDFEEDLKGASQAMLSTENALQALVSEQQEESERRHKRFKRMLKLEATKINTLNRIAMGFALPYLNERSRQETAELIAQNAKADMIEDLEDEE